MQVVQAIGAAETKLFDFGAPKRIDGEAAIKLVNVAKDLGVTQYIMVTSLGTGKIGFPASKCHRFCPIQIGFAQFKQVFPNSRRFCPIETGSAQFNRLWLSHFSIVGKLSGVILCISICVCSTATISHVLSSAQGLT